MVHECLFKEKKKNNCPSYQLCFIIKMTPSLWVDPTSATCSVSVIMFLDGFSLRFQIPRGWPEVSIRAEMGNWKQPGGTPLLKTSQQQETFALEEGCDPRGLLCCYYNKPQKCRQISVSLQQKQSTPKKRRSRKIWCGGAGVTHSSAVTCGTLQ